MSFKVRFISQEFCVADEQDTASDSMVSFTLHRCGRMPDRKDQVVSMPCRIDLLSLGGVTRVKYMSTAT